MTATIVDIVADSKVYQSGQGYERLVLIKGWNPAEERHLARLWIRVDRNPSDSFAKAEAWTEDGGWQVIVTFPPNEFWTEMPGYLRWANDTSEAKTRQLMDRLTAALVEVAKAGDL